METNPFHTVLCIVLTLGAAAYGEDSQSITGMPRGVEEVRRQRARLYAGSIQDDEQWPPLDHLKRDYRSVSIVAHVRAGEAEIASSVTGYDSWRVVCEVIEPFKGKFGRGKRVEYYVIAESGFQKERFTGEKIVFLLRHYDKQEKKRVYTALENSTLNYTKPIVEKLRLVSARHKKKSLEN
jgi:hypothetical protein